MVGHCVVGALCGGYAMVVNVPNSAQPLRTFEPEGMHEKLKTVSFNKQNREKMLSSQSTSRVCLVLSSSAVFQMR